MVVIALDPGFTGGICILKDNLPNVFRMPVLVNNQGKNQYDILKLIEILSQHIGDAPLVAIENVHTMPGQGLSSSGALLEGKGIIIGVCAALFKVLPTMVHPPSWKKAFPQLTDTKELDDRRAKLKELKDLFKNIPKPQAKTLKKEIDRLNSQFKGIVKTRTRLLASEMYPSISDEFKLVRDDGKADALFIALYAKNRVIL